ncbi:MAG TPA: type II secretion system F family protein [Methylomirabilota bacterium]|jgi:type IV pilus assembly protein PilC|nr:type II secretion system F family protein [Methylomirabilota bacterium]
MAEFVCKVADPSGRVFSQLEAAQSAGEARQKLADRGLYVYSVRPRARMFLGALRRRRERSVSGMDFLVFNQQFNTLIKAGIPILKALDLLAERAASPRLRPLLAEVRREVREGASLSDALEQQGAFPKVYTTAIVAGEKSGNLSGVLDYYIAYQRVSSGVRKRLLQTLIYPVILVCVATLIISYLVGYVIPQFATLYKDLNISLPAPTRLLLLVAVTYRPVLLLAVGAAALFLIAAFLWSRTDAGSLAMDRVKLKLPVLGDTWIKFQVSQFCRTLSTLQMGGTPLVAALETAAGSITSKLISSSVSQAAQSVREGQSLHGALSSTGVMPPLALEMIEVGEASGALSAMLGSIAEFYEEEVSLRTQAMIAIVEPSILICMAVLIAFILISLYLPIFSISVGTFQG